jgi:hypothetical protein
LYAFYKKGDRYYYTFSVGQKHSLSAKTVYGTFYELLNIVDEFLESEGVHETTDAVNTRIVLTSPGFVEFFGSAGSAIATIALLVFFVCGGVVKFRVKDSFELDLGSEGILKRLNEFLNSRQDRKIKATLLSKIASLEIKVSDDVVKIMTAANEKNQNK